MEEPLATDHVVLEGVARQEVKGKVTLVMDNDRPTAYNVSSDINGITGDATVAVRTKTHDYHFSVLPITGGKGIGSITFTDAEGR